MGRRINRILSVFCIISVLISAVSITVFENPTRAESQGNTVVLNPVADSFVRSGQYSNNNYGSSTVLELRNQGFGDQIKKAYIQFDYSELNRPADRATLRLYACTVGQDRERTATIYANNTASWSENNITWNNDPLTVSESVYVANVTITNPTPNCPHSGVYRDHEHPEIEEQWYEIDVTDFINNNTGSKLVTFMVLIENITQTNHFNINSREAEEGKPELVIEYSDEPADPGDGDDPGTGHVAVLSEDFETTPVGQVPEGWTATTGTDKVEVVELENNKCLKAHETGNGKGNTASFVFEEPITASFYIDLRVMAEDIQNEAYFLRLSDGNDEKILELYFEGKKIVRRTKTWRTVMKDIDINQWYQVHVDVNMDTKTYSVYIDGEAVAADAELLKDADSVVKYTFATNSNHKGIFYIDDILIIKEAGEPQTPENEAPVAVNVNITGSVEIGGVLTGNYQYQDSESDVEGESIYQWYRGSSADGSDKVAVPGANTTTYTVTGADAGKYLFFEVTPVAITGTLQGIPHISLPVLIPAMPDRLTYTENFEDTEPGQIPDGWTVQEGVFAVEEDSSTGNKYLYTTESGGQNNMAFVSFASVTGNITMDISVLARQTNGTAWFTLRDSNGVKAVELAYNTSWFAYKDPNNTHIFLCNYNANQWYQFHVEIDLDSKTFSVSVGGVSKSNLPLMNPVDEISQFVFSTYRSHNGTFQIDDIVITGDEELPVNSAPVAHDVTIEGTPAPGEILTGSYIYEDAEGDAEDAERTVYQWYRSSEPDGSDKTAIEGANSITYTVTSADQGRYLIFEVIPAAQTGTATGSPATSEPLLIAGVTNQAPVATYVAITGTPETGQILTGDYVYFDNESDEEGTSTYQWYRGQQSDGSYREAIEGANSRTYTVTEQDVNKYLWFEVTPVAQTGYPAGIPVMSEGVYISPGPADAGTITGNAVTFDSSGIFTDELTNLESVFSYNKVQSNGNAVISTDLTDTGDFSYYSGESAGFKSLAIDVTYNKWPLNFTTEDELAVYEAEFDSINQKFTYKNKVNLVRKLRPDKMTDTGIVKATYITTGISEDAKYLVVKMPRPGYFAGTAAVSDFRIDRIVLESSDSDSVEPEGYIIDNAVDFSRLSGMTDTTNLRIVTTTDIWVIRTFGQNSYYNRMNASLETNMIYQAPEGMQFKSVYVEGYHYQSVPGANFEVRISNNGVNFWNITKSSDYLHYGPGSSGNNNIPDVLQITDLPDGAKYLLVKLPGGTPNFQITKVVLEYETATEEPITTSVTVKKAASKVTLDGIVELDQNGNPAGEWSGSQYIRIYGAIDDNGDKHSADIYLQYDYENLYIGAKIKDPTPMENTRTGSGIWNGDCLELFIGVEDLDFTQYPSDGMIPSDIQIVFSGGKTNGYQSYFHTNGVTTFPVMLFGIEPDEDGKGYTIEAAIPLDVLGFEKPWQNEGMELILNAVLNDGASPGRGQWGWTTEGEQVKKSRGLWGRAAFEAVPDPDEEIEVTVNVDNESQLVTVSGRTKNVHGKFVSMLVRDPDGDIFTFDQVESDEQGNFAFSFNMNRKDEQGNGVYNVLIGGQEIQVPVETSFDFTFTEVIPDFTISSVEFTDVNGANITSLAASGFLKGRITITNNRQETAQAAMIVALYNKNNTLQRLSLVGRQMNAGETIEMEAGFDLPEDVEGSYVKVFVWDSLEEMNPLSDEVRFPN